MKHLSWVVLGICCAAPMGAEEVAVFTPSRQGDAPIYMNGEIVRIDRAASTITVRSDNGLMVLNLDRQTRASLGSVGVGSSVILGLRSSGAGATARSVVTDLRPTGALSRTGRVSANASMVSSGPRTIGTARLPRNPNDTLDRNPATAGVQPAPGAQPLPGVQGPTGIQPVPSAQPLPGTGVTGQTAANPALVPQPVPGTAGRTSNNASPVLGPSVPQLGGVATGGINSPIPSIPPSPGSLIVPVLPVPSVMPATNPPRTPNEVAAVREQASRDFDMAVAVLAARAAEVDRAWIAYRSGCAGSTVPLNNRAREWFGVLDGSIIAPTDDVCEASYNEVARLAQGFQATLDNARDTARRADVLPGRMREILQRYDLDL